MGILTGRDRIALTDGDDDVELNVSIDIQHSYPAEITRHTVENEKGKTSITDHVVPGQRGISLNVFVSSSVDATSLSRRSVDDKLEILVRWQSQGTLVTLLGYETGGILSKILSLLPSSFRYVQPDDPEKRYLGRSRDEIPNLMIGDMNLQEGKDTGDDVALGLSLFPVVIAEAKTRASNEVKSAGKRSVQKQSKSGEPVSGKGPK